MFRGCCNCSWVFSQLVVVTAIITATSRSGGMVQASGVGVTEEDITSLIDWIRSRGGIFSDKLDVKRYGGDPEAPFGIFAKEDIPEDDVLFSIPRSVLITAEDDTSTGYGAMWCPTVFNLIREMRLGGKSAWAPYINYLLKQEPGQLPSAYSREAVELLQKILRHRDGKRHNDLPPAEVAGWIDEDWKGTCEGSDDPLEQNAALLLVQRGWDDIMIPGYDLLSHRNGKQWLNTKTAGSVYDESSPIVVKANQIIKAGSELYTSYNFCEDCGGKSSGYGTPEMYRDYGFVEQMPQQWNFRFNVDFILDEDPSTGEIYLEWIEKKPGKKGIKFLKDSLKHLSKEEFDIALADPTTNEMKTIKQFRDAMKNAIVLALQRVEGGCASPEDGVCRSTGKYDALDWEKDETHYAIYICDTDKSMSFKGFDHIEDLESHYQKIDFYKDPKNENVCFDINNIIQMCGSYRPHYHEMSVHYPARFLPKMKRVLWVGGGDSMLLHEFLKYPEVELIIGLELDQQITRYSFKHTGTQPHWDNPKVQWWYGDASKTMLMLPESYFGTFDLIVVDLSETVMSMTVTEGLDIFGALSLLMKPGGLFVKNELYFEQLSQIFDYTLQIHYPGVPVICSQCLVIGGNEIDFMYDPLVDHKLTAPNVYIEEMDAIEDRYEYFHDYRRRHNRERLCVDELEEKKVTKQTRSPGILMIVEVEDCSISLSDPEAVKERLTKACGDQGLTLITTLQSSSEEISMVGVLLEEGYLVARAYPNEKYVSVDLHFWSSYEKHESTKISIINALGAVMSQASSYRIVAGGVFGVKTWKEDELKRGPSHLAEKCANEAVVERKEKVDSAVVTPMIAETLKVIDEKGDFISLVLCGDRGSTCQASSSVAELKGSSNTISIYPCDNVKELNPYEEYAVEKMRDCEVEIKKQLKEVRKIRAVFIDPECPRVLAQIFYKIVEDDLTGIIAENHVVFSLMLDESEEWRRHLLERFRKRQIDPMFRAEALFNTTDASAEMGVVSAGDEGFVQKFRASLDRIAEKTGLKSSIRSIEGGLYRYDEHWKPSHFFLPQDYDQNSPLEQYMSQKPVGYQTVFQLESDSKVKTGGMSADKIQETFEKALSDFESAAVQVVGEPVSQGAAFIALWPGGTCSVLWDGRKHVDVNIYTSEENKDVATRFANHFLLKLKLKLVLKDVQPRGYGRVVNFKSDLDEPRTHPHWAIFKE